MRGWLPDGRETELSQQQERAVRALLHGMPVTLAEGPSKDIVFATVARYQALDQGDSHATPDPVQRPAAAG